MVVAQGTACGSNAVRSVYQGTFIPPPPPRLLPSSSLLPPPSGRASFLELCQVELSFPSPPVPPALSSRSISCARTPPRLLPYRFPPDSRHARHHRTHATNRMRPTDCKWWPQPSTVVDLYMQRALPGTARVVRMSVHAP
jgi:hypothetical protein